MLQKMKQWLGQHPEGPRNNDWDLGDEIDTAQDLTSDLLDTIYFA